MEGVEGVEGSLHLLLNSVVKLKPLFKRLS